MNEKANKFVFNFVAPNGVQSSCNIYHIDINNFHYVGFEDISKGVSVTNASEFIATEVVKKMKWNPENCLFFEWYLTHKDKNDGVDNIEYTWVKREATNPKWKRYYKHKENPFKC